MITQTQHDVLEDRLNLLYNLANNVANVPTLAPDKQVEELSYCAAKSMSVVNEIRLLLDFITEENE